MEKGTFSDPKCARCRAFPVSVIREGRDVFITVRYDIGGQDEAARYASLTDDEALASLWWRA